MYIHGSLWKVSTWEGDGKMIQWLCSIMFQNKSLPAFLDFQPCNGNTFSITTVKEQLSLECIRPIGKCEEFLESYSTQIIVKFVYSSKVSQNA